MKMKWYKNLSANDKAQLKLLVIIIYALALIFVITKFFK